MLRAFTDAHSGGRVRITGEPIWPGRSSFGYPACVQHEALINAAFRGCEVTILCPYDADRLEPDVLADAWSTHPLVIDAVGELPSDSYDPERVIARCNEPLVCPTTRSPHMPDLRHTELDRATVDRLRTEFHIGSTSLVQGR